MPAKKKSHGLSQFSATAIAGNDILSSALYVSGIAALFVGIYAPLILFAVAIILFFYRTVYREVVEALPINGGAYNALLNGTSKRGAAIAGVMTALSYVATAVISAKTAIEYLFFFIEKMTTQTGGPSLHLTTWILPAVIAVLFLFAILVISGVKDSARVATAIFILHILTLSAFAVYGIFFVVSHGNTSWILNILATTHLVQEHGGLIKTLFFGFSASLLGVSGFETSANFVEEQKPGVFAKTLRNMACGVLIFNPLIALVALNILPLAEITASKDFMLAQAAFSMGGLVLAGWIAIDAFLVLCGAVLTSYVGVSGLLYRMAIDGCIPGWFGHKNRFGSRPRILVGFFLLCASILLLTKGDLLSLSGVYTISFLSVMTLFAASNLILRMSRPDLKRPYRAPLLIVLLAMLSTLVGVMGNISINPDYTGYFLTYFIPACLFVFAFLYRKNLYRTLAKISSVWEKASIFFERQSEKAADEHIVAFVHHTNRLFLILDYIHRNETGHHITLVHCHHHQSEKSISLEHIVQIAQRAGFFPYFTINVDYLDKPFGPKLVRTYAKKHHIPLNKIFIGSIHHYHEYNYEDLGGVRIIL